MRMASDDAEASERSSVRRVVEVVADTKSALIVDETSFGCYACATDVHFVE
jgi:hypothetical protein